MNNRSQTSMKTLKAEVKNGRLVLDEPTSLPKGTVLELSLAEPEDELDPEERAALHQALAESWESARAGRLRPVDELLEDLRSK